MSPGLRDEFDEPESDETEDDDVLDEQEVAAAQDREQWGPFVPPDGWHVLPAPAVDNGGWGHLLPDYRWTNKRLAHIWDNHGWDVATCRGYNHNTKRSEFYYASDKQTAMTHCLLIEEYGMTKSWVIFAKDS